ncbi:HLA class II histocompatibility antigen; DRB1-4 beta chain [Camelus dromedarius]|uniref:HLA class II histocompatibility antigen n=1 Tax=Camelus dromedarius TaxID=9838 RepID=A0A5N4CT45_CAMDR|nr:HLA class II histocompatibility antigen; DRB1-4 beta chain [Camelus dromedarius]
MWIGGGSQCPFEWDLPAPITRYLLLISSMVCLYFSGGSWMAALTVILMVLSPSLVWTKDTQPRFMVQAKSECHFSNGTERVQFLDRYFYNLEELLRFDSDWGEQGGESGGDRAGRGIAEDFNSRKDVLEQTRAAVDTVLQTQLRGLEPTVTVYPVKPQPLQHH